mgnify:CR=1 FL=1|tara:strand:- start:227 stop:412 length:186 start_codon:yes stop_codon:yes gene_type:complete
MELFKAVILSLVILSILVGVIHLILKRLFKNQDIKLVWLWLLFIVTWIDLIGLQMEWWRLF